MARQQRVLVNNKSSKAAMLRECERLLKEWEQEMRHHTKADQLADRRSIELDNAKKNIARLKEEIKTLEANLNRALGYIDRIKDTEKTIRTEPDPPKHKLKTISDKPCGPYQRRTYSPHERMPF